MDLQKIINISVLASFNISHFGRTSYSSHFSLLEILQNTENESKQASKEVSLRQRWKIFFFVFLCDDVITSEKENVLEWHRQHWEKNIFFFPSHLSFFFLVKIKLYYSRVFTFEYTKYCLFSLAHLLCFISNICNLCIINTTTFPSYICYSEICLRYHFFLCELHTIQFAKNEIEIKIFHFIFSIVIKIIFFAQ